jgi:hypothetical protein
MKEIKILTDAALVEKTLCLVREERRLTLEVIHHLHEIDARKLYLERGYPSLFEFCMRELGYEEGPAYRRIAAMRLIREIPEVEVKVQEGKLSLSTVSQLQGFFRSEKKRGEGLSLEEKKDLLQACEGMSKRETERLLLEKRPEARPFDRERPITATETELRMVIDEDLRKKLERLRNLVAHRNPNPTYNELLHILADVALERLDPAERKVRNPPSPGKVKVENSGKVKVENSGKVEVENSAKVKVENSGGAKATPGEGSSKSKASSELLRFPNAALKREIWIRDRGKCQYRDLKTGRVCASSFQVQVDHVEPFSLGGKTTAENLRLLCRKHNHWAAEGFRLG